jgi:branched-chain amino acid transport system permease protein
MIFFQELIAGMAVGSIYALVALGFVLIYKATEVINFAQGEFMMLGTFIAFTLVSILELPFILASFLTLFLMGLFGIVIERIFLRPLLGQPLFALIMVTFGLSFVIRSMAGMIWTYDHMKFPSPISDETFQVGDITLSWIYVWIIVIALLLVVSLAIFFKYTNTGLAMKACGINQLATLYMGISVKRIFSLTWAISAIVATVAGLLIVPVVTLQVNMGFLGLKAFPAAVIGGFGSIPGAIIGGLIIGITETFSGIYLPEGIKNIFAHALLILVLMIKPTGIFGVPERKRV